MNLRYALYAMVMVVQANELINKQIMEDQFVRLLRSASSRVVTNRVGSHARFEPLRIKMVKNPNHEENLDGNIGKALEEARQYWQSKLKVQRESNRGRLKIWKTTKTTNFECPEDGEKPYVHLMLGAGPIEEQIAIQLPFGEQAYEQCSPDPSVGGFEADLVIALLYDADGKHYCKTKVLALATHFQLSSLTRRPTFGLINVCEKINDKGYDDMVEVFKHEIAHILGYSYSLYTAFHKAESRRFSYDRKIDRLYRFGNKAALLRYMKKPETGNIFTTSSDGKRLYLSTPCAKAVARKYFNCHSMPGIPVEFSGDRSKTSHFLEKKLEDDLMSPKVTVKAELTPLTFAVLQDSGWYELVDKTLLTKFDRSLFGYNAGCQKSCGTDCGRDVASKQCSIPI